MFGAGENGGESADHRDSAERLAKFIESSIESAIDRAMERIIHEILRELRAGALPQDERRPAAAAHTLRPLRTDLVYDSCCQGLRFLDGGSQPMTLHMTTLSERQAAVMAFLLASPRRYHLPVEIASAALGGAGKSAVYKVISRLRDLCGDTHCQLIRTSREDGEHQGYRGGYGIFPTIA